MKIIPVEDKKILEQVFKFTRNKRVTLYVVGGYLRDLFLDRKKYCPDIDFCLPRGAINFGRKLAKELHAGFVVLDKEHGACRIVKKTPRTIYTLDFTDFRGPSLEEDLLHRDFTINTLALSLKDMFSPDMPKHIIDFYGAMGDLKLKNVKATSPGVFREDPLRILRAFSLSAIFDFEIDKQTLCLIKKAKGLLKDVSSERVRDELFKILAQSDSFSYLIALDKLKILSLVIPEIEIMRGVTQGPYHHLNVLEHSFETLKQLENLMQEKKSHKEINFYLDESFSSERKRRALIKLAALLHDIGKPQAKRRKNKKTIFHGHEGIGARITTEIVRRLKLSNLEIGALRKMVFWHLRPGYLADNENITPRAIFRYFRDSGEEGVSILLLSVADQRATRGRLTSKTSRLRHEEVVSGLIKEYFRKAKEKKLPRLLTGNDLMKVFKLSPSPLVGEILDHLEELQATNFIKTKSRALLEARRLIKKRG